MRVGRESWTGRWKSVLFCFAVVLLSAVPAAVARADGLNAGTSLSEQRIPLCHVALPVDPPSLDVQAARGNCPLGDQFDLSLRNGKLLIATSLQANDPGYRSIWREGQIRNAWPYRKLMQRDFTVLAACATGARDGCRLPAAALPMIEALAGPKPERMWHVQAAVTNAKLLADLGVFGEDVFLYQGGAGLVVIVPVLGTFENGAGAGQLYAMHYYDIGLIPTGHSG